MMKKNTKVRKCDYYICDMRLINMMAASMGKNGRMA